MGRVYEALRRAAENGAKGNGDGHAPPHDGEATAEHAPAAPAAPTNGGQNGHAAPDGMFARTSPYYNAPGAEAAATTTAASRPTARGPASTEHNASAPTGSALSGGQASRVAGATVDAVGSARAGDFPSVEISPARVEPHLIAITDPRSARAEQYRSLRARVLQAGERRNLQALVVTSAGVMEGKTVTALNLAWLLAQADGVRALLVDGDLRHPCAGEYLGIDAPVGLSEVLAGEANLGDTIVRLEPAGLHLLPGGTARDDAPELLSGPRFSAVLAELRRTFDYVIIDAPPLGLFSDASVLINRADGALVVVRSGRTRYAELDRVLEPLPRERLLGVVLNGADEKLDESSYYYQRRYYRREETTEKG